MNNKHFKKHFKTLELDKIAAMLAERCVCAEAARAAEEIQPADNLSSAAALLGETEDAYILTARFGAPSFPSVKNMSGPLRRAEAGGLLSMGDLLETAGVLRGVRRITEWRSHSEGVSSSLDRYFGRLCQNKYLEEKITSAIVSEEEMSDSASPALYNIRRKIINTGAGIREKLDSMIRSATYQKYLQDPVVTQRDGRFVVPVKAEFRANVPGLVHDTSSSGSTLFIEPMAVVEANNEIKVLKSAEAEEIERILYELSAEAGEFADSIIDSQRVMTELDLIFAKAKLGFDMRASVPLLNDEGIIELRRVRHPLLQKDKAVPVDVSLGTGFDSLIITGPNTGGKTVTLKSIGLICLMAACGLLVPCADNSRVAVFGSIFADIGDEQSIEQSLSTFSSHIKNIVNILNSADSRSLVLLDELCSGTDPVEGAALSYAVIERLRSLGVRLAATTHYAELKAYALDTEGVMNACCEFDVETLSPTYRLLIGVPGKSNAFAIAEKLGIPPAVIESARGAVSENSDRFERVAQELQSAHSALEKEREAAAEARRAAETASLEAKETLARLKKDYDEKIEQARGEARIIADNARAEVNRILDELERIKKDKRADSSAARAAAKAGFKKLDAIAGEGQKFDDEYTLPRELRIGDTVTAQGLSSPATVIALGAKQVTVQAGLIKMKLDIGDIRLAEDAKPSRKNAAPRRGEFQSQIDRKSERSASMEIDIRGMNVDEAVLELDRFIDTAVINGQNTVTVIHGKGTGALRAGVHSYLRRHKSIRTFRLGTFGEGESGVTIAELK
ncbi:MAG: endonuclease MutS2 [Acutalibacteraceae bacterium]